MHGRPLTRAVSPFVITLPTALAAVALALLLLPVPPAHGQNGSVAWIAPTRADNSRFTVTTGKSLTLTLAASTSRAAEVGIKPVLGLPPGATVSNSADNGESRAVFRWRPTEVGDYTLKFVASTGPGASAPPLTYLIRVNPDIRYPRSYTLTDATIGHWAKVLRRTVVRSQPRSSARAVTTLDLLTSDDTQNLVLVLGGVDQSPTKTWYRIRLAILPNNSTGWVPKEALGDLVTATTHLYIDRAKYTITLERNGTTIFKANVGVGRSYWPTPRGEFYIRDELTDFASPAYGPIAFGTSARSTTLTDWPGGGVIGIHGTNQPELLPGSISHGCVRMRNADIRKLARLIKVGTPLTIR